MKKKTKASKEPEFAWANFNIIVEDGYAQDYALLVHHVSGRVLASYAIPVPGRNPTFRCSPGDGLGFDSAEFMNADGAKLWCESAAKILLRKRRGGVSMAAEPKLKG